MEKIVLASNNKHKIIEFKEMFKNQEILTLNDIGFTEEIEETGKEYIENALIKAETIRKYLDDRNISYVVIADDSGLNVDELNGEPGVYSARYAGEHGDSEKNRKKLLSELNGIENRKAKFICVIVACYADGTKLSVEGTTEGKITFEEIGCKDFGYDCLFMSDDLNKTFGEATSEEKNSVSHRSRALKKIVKLMEEKKK